MSCTLEDIRIRFDVTDYWCVNELGESTYADESTDGDYVDYACVACGEGLYDWQEAKRHIGVES